MAREILFRGKRIDNGEWVNGYVTRIKRADDNGNAESYYFNALDELGWIAKCAVSAETVCQYTGLADKNGRKIFEGDIITYQHDNDDCPFPNKDTKRRVGRVYFQEFRSCFAVAEGRNGTDRINQDLFKYVQNGNRVEVIVNIFDNPELMEVD